MTLSVIPSGPDDNLDWTISHECCLFVDMSLIIASGSDRFFEFVSTRHKVIAAAAVNYHLRERTSV